MTSKITLSTDQIRHPKKSIFAGKSDLFWALFGGISWTVLSCKSSTSLQFYYYCHPESRNSPSSREKDRSAKSVERNRLIIDYGLLKRPWRHLWRRQRIRKWKIISACLWRSPRRKYQINPKENQQSQWNNQIQTPRHAVFSDALRQNMISHATSPGRESANSGFAGKILSWKNLGLLNRTFVTRQTKTPSNTDLEGYYCCCERDDTE